MRTRGLPTAHEGAIHAMSNTITPTNRQRAALAWTEVLTLITEGRAPDEVYAEVRKEFGEEELVKHV